MQSEIVEPAQIEERLSAIWEQSRGSAKVRATLFNLIVYAQKQGSIGYLEGIISKILQRFPSRVLFITVDEASEEELLKTGVSLVPVSGGVACDLITMELSRSTKERAPFLILPHLATDLPIYLMWGADPAIDPSISSSIERFATKVIFDSASSGKLSHFSSSLIDHHRRENLPIADLNWARVKGWRTLLSAIFSEKDKLPLLEHIQEVRIEYQGNSPIQALYLQGWIALKLGWNQQKIEQKESSFHLLYDKASICLSSKEMPELDLGRIISICLTTEQRETCLFQRHPDTPHLVFFEMTTPERCEIPISFPMDQYESGQSLVGEIFHSHTSVNFLSLLPLMRNLPC